MLATAHQVMEFAHKGQFRWNGVTPYSVHPEQVVNLLRHRFGVKDEEILAAGYLHDVIEDTDYPPQNIKSIFGPRVYSLVNELTFKQDQNDTYYFEHVRGLSSDAKLIKAADILANLNDEGKKSKHYVEKRTKALKIIFDELRY